MTPNALKVADSSWVPLRRVTLLAVGPSGRDAWRWAIYAALMDPRETFELPELYDSKDAACAAVPKLVPVIEP
jgi:hypothetical protein